MEPHLSLYRSLSREWAAVGSSRHARRRLADWGADQPALASFSSPADVVEFCQSARGAAANRLLGVLIELDDDLAARAVLQSLLPGLAAMSRRARRRWPWMFDHRCDGPWVDWGFDHEAVATAHARIRALGGASITWPATTVLEHTWRHARSLEERHRRGNAAACLACWGAPVIGPLVESMSPDDLDRTEGSSGSESAADELAVLLSHAVRLGLVGERGAALVYESRIVGRPVAEIARQTGQDERLLRYHRGRAERLLITGLSAA